MNRYLRNPISQNPTKKFQKRLYEIVQFLKIVKILAFSPCYILSPFCMKVKENKKKKKKKKKEKNKNKKRTRFTQKRG
jgi:hypothetical protein